jgi:hypothetical protein
VVVTKFVKGGRYKYLHDDVNVYECIKPAGDEGTSGDRAWIVRNMYNGVLFMYHMWPESWSDENEFTNWIREACSDGD